jgi:hypothetical protein
VRASPSATVATRGRAGAPRRASAAPASRAAGAGSFGRDVRRGDAAVGTRDLGQEVYVALVKASTGRGIVAGLCIAFIAIVADRLIVAAARGARERFGIQG